MVMKQVLVNKVTNLQCGLHNGKAFVFFFICSLLIVFLQSINFLQDFSIIYSFDEVFCICLLLYGLKNKVLANKEFRGCVVILTLYLIISIVQQNNVWQAALGTYLSYFKPVACFYVVYSSRFTLTLKDLKVLRKWSRFLILPCVLLFPIFSDSFNNLSSYYPLCLFVGLMNLLFFKWNKKNVIVAFCVLGLGIITFKSKYIAICVVIGSIYYFVNNHIKINIKYLLLFSLIVFACIYLTYSRFSSYFLVGDTDSVARTALYYHAIEILRDYFPLGSGLGTYGTESAAKYYSPLYAKYGMDTIFGLTRADYQTEYDFLKDTYFPSLAEFGISGIFLYFYFWYKRWRDFSLSGNMKYYKLGIILIFIVNIENIANLVFMLGNCCLPIFMLLGYVCSFCKSIKL